MARPRTLINMVLVAALLCALPASLLARPRPHAAPRSRQQTRPHASRSSRAVEHPHPAKHRRHTAAAPSKRYAAAKLTRISIAPHASVRSGWLAASRKPDPKATPVLHPEEKDLPEATEMEVPPPSDFTGLNDVPASMPVPVVSVIRKTTERPQLPSIEEAASTPAILPSLYNNRGHLVVPPALKGSHEILIHQNEMADRDGLTRVRDDDDLAAMRRGTMLVALPVSGAMRIDDRLPFNRRFCRPWTAQFLTALARAHYAQFHTALQVNSAVRTVAIQQRLMRTNGNAAPAAGATASPHLTGQAIDLAKRGMPLEEIAWMRGYLLPLVREGKIDVEEEFQQSCFHISVYKAFDPTPNRMIAVTHRDRPAALAIALQ